MDLISLDFRLNFREFCVGLYLGQIDDIFLMAGIEPDADTARAVNGARRSRVEEYYASIDWSDVAHVQKFLKAVGLVLAQTRISDEAKNEIRELCKQEGLIVDGHTVRLRRGSTKDNIKNLIFAANGPKPEIVLDDAIANQIKIVRNAEYCLVYEEPILPHGLLWQEMVNWWAKRTGMEGLSSSSVAEELYRRLTDSLDSTVEKWMMHDYFVHFHDPLGVELPALVPQVYFHYDPYTLRQLQGKKRIPRQRMDFLLLLPNDVRIVIEIDGKHHYADEKGKASPRLYAEMAREDRNLKQAGYEVYRFGGYELMNRRMAKQLTRNFYDTIFEQYLT